MSKNELILQIKKMIKYSENDPSGCNEYHRGLEGGLESVLDLLEELDTDDE